MSGLLISDENPSERNARAVTPQVILAYLAAGAYLTVPVLLCIDEVVCRTFILSRTFPQLQTPVRVLYFPFMCLGYLLGLIPWSPPQF